MNDPQFYFSLFENGSTNFLKKFFPGVPVSKEAAVVGVLDIVNFVVQNPEFRYRQEFEKPTTPKLFEGKLKYLREIVELLERPSGPQEESISYLLCRNCPLPPEFSPVYEWRESLLSLLSSLSSAHETLDSFKTKGRPTNYLHKMLAKRTAIWAVTCGVKPNLGISIDFGLVALLEYCFDIAGLEADDPIYYLKDEDYRNFLIQHYEESINENSQEFALDTLIDCLRN